jgi:enoyl-CoA hydratase/carnithine racemase
MSSVELETLEDNIAGVTLNRPDRLNAIDGSLINEFDKRWMRSAAASSAPRS